MSFRIQEKGKEEAKKRIKEFVEASKRVTVGIHGDADGDYEGGATVLEIGAIHEFGLGVPERSFVRAWVDDYEPDIEQKIKAVAVQYAKGKVTLEEGLNQLGAWAKGSMQQRISDGIDPPLADSTIARKGSSTPLIDTNTLRSSIDYKVKDSE